MWRLSEREIAELDELVLRCLREDLGISANAALPDIHQLHDHDPSSAVFPAEQQSTATITSREDRTMCGAPWAEKAIRLLDPNVECRWLFDEGDQVAANSVIATITGNTRAQISAERTMLNLLQVLMATATNAQQVASIASSHGIVALDTRKTLPGMRIAQKYATRTGGMSNHRIGLYDQIMIKDNHIDAVGSIRLAVERVRENKPDLAIVVEVRDFEQLEEAASCDVDVIMLDNFAVQQWREAHERLGGRALTEVSGNLSHEDLGVAAQCGIDRISLGGVTKSIRAVDLSMSLSKL